jgi:hypothetical protein
MSRSTAAIRAESGAVFLVEIDENAGIDQEIAALRNLPPGSSAISGGDSYILSLAENAGTGLKNALSAVAETVSDALRDHGPSECTVEFSMDFKGKTGIPLIVSGETGAKIAVKMTWKK